jgi:integrase/recombinase XerD
MKPAVAVAAYLTYKHSLGCRFRTEQAVLNAFCKSISDTPFEDISSGTILLFLGGNGEVTSWWYKKYNVLCGLYRFAIAREWVKTSPLPHTTPKLTAPPFIPHIYTPEELKRLIDCVPAACTARTPIEAGTFRALLLLLYGTGLRIGEALALNLNDFDLEFTSLCVKDSKFFKTRLVPLNKDLQNVMTQYLNVNHVCHNASLDIPLFCFCDGRGLSQSAVRSTFRRLRKIAAVARDDGSRYQPRIHDLRHTAAVHRLIAWYQSGANLQDLLPKLATYLGHVSLASTQHYLTMTPELMQQASNCFERYARGGYSDE